MSRTLALSALLLAAATVRADGVDDLVRDAMTKQKIPGLTLAVVKA